MTLPRHKCGVSYLVATVLARARTVQRPVLSWMNVMTATNPLTNTLNTKNHYPAFMAGRCLTINRKPSCPAIGAYCSATMPLIGNFNMKRNVSRPCVIIASGVIFICKRQSAFTTTKSSGVFLRFWHIEISNLHFAIT